MSVQDQQFAAEESWQEVLKAKVPFSPPVIAFVPHTRSCPQDIFCSHVRWVLSCLLMVAMSATGRVEYLWRFSSHVREKTSAPRPGKTTGHFAEMTEKLMCLFLFVRSCITRCLGAYTYRTLIWFCSSRFLLYREITTSSNALTN